MTITHKFVSVRADGSDATQVNPTNWNDTHAVSGFGTQAISGAVDGSNLTFVVALTLTDFLVFRNGLLQMNNTDYTWSVGGGNTTVVFVNAPGVGDSIFIWGV